MRRPARHPDVTAPADDLPVPPAPTGRRSARPATARRPRVSLPRRIRPGTRLALEPGHRIRAVELARSGGERIAVEVATGALIRIQSPTDTQAPSGAVPVAPTDGEEYLDDRHYPDDRADRLAGPGIIEFVVAGGVEEVDPARPEAVYAAAEPVTINRPKRRPLRRLCRAVAATERRGATILGSWGPSRAYVDLDVSAPSVMLVAVGRRTLELMSGPDEEVTLSLTWGGTTQLLPVVDPRARAAAFAHRPRSLRGDPLAGALGFRPGYVLVALDHVRGGHVRKVVYAILPR